MSQTQQIVEKFNDPLKAALVEIIQKCLNGIDKGVDFLNAQLPDVIEQLLMWKMWESIAINLIVLIFAFLIPLVLVIRNFKKGFAELTNDEISSCGFLLLVGGVWMFLGSIILLCVANSIWLQILIAPKIYLIEYVAELIK